MSLFCCHSLESFNLFLLIVSHNLRILSVEQTVGIGVSITVQLTSSLTNFDLTNQVKLMQIQHEQSY